MLITIPNLYPYHSQTITNLTVYSDSLLILIHFPYPTSKTAEGLLMENNVLLLNTKYSDLTQTFIPSLSSPPLLGVLYIRLSLLQYLL